MIRRNSNRITRRDALRQLTGAVASASFWSVAARAQGASPPASESPATAAGKVIATEPNGTEIHQVTVGRGQHSDIYCEVPYCSRDSRYFVYRRFNPSLTGNRTELMVVELGTWKEHRLDVAVSDRGCAITPAGIFYYLKSDGKELMLMRANLAQGTPQVVYRRKDGPWVRNLGTVTSDGRYFAGSVALDDQYRMFGVVLVDLQKGQEAIIDRDPCIFNNHSQFEPGQGRWLMIQQNRGGKLAPDGQIERRTGPEGGTLYLLSIPDGQRTALHVGQPYTTPISGHEAWIGPTGRILFTVSATGEFAPEKGNVLTVAPGVAPRVLARGYKCNHVGVSRCGRLFSVDDFQGAFNIVIGSTTTGRSVVAFASKTTATSNQSTHPHAYLTPDLKWVIFNSTRSGWPQVYAAHIPDAIVRGVLAT